MVALVFLPLKLYDLRPVAISVKIQLIHSLIHIRSSQNPALKLPPLHAFIYSRADSITTTKNQEDKSVLNNKRKHFIENKYINI